MAKQREGVYERVLECARREFLAKGYQNASLRSIAGDAGTSTGSIYTRFGGKSGLFRAIVAPAADGLLQWFHDTHETFHRLPSAIQHQEAYTYGQDKFIWFVDYIYDHFSDFQLITGCSEGTEYADFINQLAEIDMEYNVNFARTIGSDVYQSGRLSHNLMHMLTTAFYSGIFETVVRNMPREEAQIYTAQLRRFFLCGWRDIFEGRGE